MNKTPIRKRPNLSRRETRLFAGVFALVGIVILARTFAANPLAFETESGAVSAGAAIVSLSAASGQQAVKFASTPTSTPTPTPTPTPSSPSGQAMPMGDLPHWKQTLKEDFLTDATTSTFDATYANSWCGYDDGTGGKYYKVISATGGMQRFNLDGTRGAAGSWGPPSTCWGGIYGKYTMRFRVTGAAGYGAANMVWPTSNIWGEGEVDYPEGNFDSSMQLFQHDTNCSDCGNIASLDTGQPWTTWHTVSTEWTPAGVSYYLDGALIKTVTTNVPFNRHRWTLQMAKTAATASSGTFDVDWVTSYTYVP